MSGDIYLNIDSVVLRGLGPVDRQALKASLEQALITQLFSSSALTDAERSQVKTDIKVPGPCSANQLGRTLGKTLGQNLSGIITNKTPAASSSNNPNRGGSQDA